MKLKAVNLLFWLVWIASDGVCYTKIRKEFTKFHKEILCGSSCLLCGSLCNSFESLLLPPKSLQISY